MTAINHLLSEAGHSAAGIISQKWNCCVSDPAGFHKLVTATPAPRMPFSIHLLTSATPGAGESGCQERETKPQLPAGGQRNTSLERQQNASSWTCEGGQERHALKSEQEKLVKAVEERRIKYVVRSSQEN